MTEPTNDDSEAERKKRKDGESETGSGSATSGFVRASSDGVARAASNIDEAEAQRKKRSEGDSESGTAAAGTAYTRASGEGIVKLSVEQTKKVWAEFRHLDLNEVVAAVAEFFSEFPARASANLSVAWETTNKGGFAIINMAIKFGQDVATAVRERTRESAVQVRKRYGIDIKVRRGGISANIAPNQPGVR